jgi:hypothetical protein
LIASVRVDKVYPPNAARRLSTARIHSSRIEPEVAVGDHAVGLLERQLGLLDQVPGSADL